MHTAISPMLNSGRPGETLFQIVQILLLQDEYVVEQVVGGSLSDKFTPAAFHN
jgi:hypothetical protein